MVLNNGTSSVVTLANFVTKIIPATTIPINPAMVAKIINISRQIRKAFTKSISVNNNPQIE